MPSCVTLYLCMHDTISCYMHGAIFAFLPSMCNVVYNAYSSNLEKPLVDCFWPFFKDGLMTWKVGYDGQGR